MRIRATPGVLLLAFALMLANDPMLPATVVAAAIHELGHLFAAKRLRIGLRVMELDLFGAQIYPKGILPSYRAELLLSAAGPLASLLLFVVALPFRSDFFVLLRTTTLSLALFNLLPIAGFDGGRMLSSLLSCFFRPQAVGRLLSISSYLVLLFLFLLSSCLLLRYGQNLTLAVLSASLFARLFLQLER